MAPASISFEPARATVASARSVWAVSPPLLFGLAVFAATNNPTGLPLLGDPDSHWQKQPLQEFMLLLALYLVLSRGVKLPLVRLVIVIGLVHLFLRFARNAELMATLVRYVRAINLRGKEPFEALLDRYGIDWTLLPRDQPVNQFLARLPGWRRV